MNKSATYCPTPNDPAPTPQHWDLSDLLPDSQLRELTAEQAAVMEQVINFPNVEEAAQRAGCTVKSIRNWMEEPTFRGIYLQARRATVEAAIGKIQNLTGEAVRVLQRNLACGKPFFEIRAASAALLIAQHGPGVIDQEGGISKGNLRKSKTTPKSEIPGNPAI